MSKKLRLNLAKISKMSGSEVYALYMYCEAIVGHYDLQLIDMKRNKKNKKQVEKLEKLKKTWQTITSNLKQFIYGEETN